MRTFDLSFRFFFNASAATELYTLSLHDALPISTPDWLAFYMFTFFTDRDGKFQLCALAESELAVDRKSTRLNSSHANISYAVFCLKKKIIKIEPEARLLDSALTHSGLQAYNAES